MRGLEKQLSCERLKVNLLVSRRELVHVDTLDLYAARLRRTFLQEAAAELFVEEATLKQDLGHVLLELELRQDALIRERVARQRQPEMPVMTELERTAALELLQDPQLLARITADYAACGLVGEETNKLVCYLACVSRLLPRPLSVLIQSSSAAGKTSLLEATLQFMPPEAQLRWSALSGQSLYYLGRDELKHKILAVAEEEGVSEASYALKLLQSEGRLSLAVATKESETGRGRTEYYEVEGPVALLLTTTRDDGDGELANRCLTLSVNEQPQQTAAIHQRQRAAYTRDGLASEAQVVRTRHQCAQRLLEPLGVVIPWADKLTFRTDQTRYRRDHAKYLSLIAALTLAASVSAAGDHAHARWSERALRGGHARGSRGGQPVGQRHAGPPARRAPAADPPATRPTPRVCDRARGPGTGALSRAAVLAAPAARRARLAGSHAAAAVGAPRGVGIPRRVSHRMRQPESVPVVVVRRGGHRGLRRTLGPDRRGAL